LLQEQGKVSGVADGGLATIETLEGDRRETDLFARWAGIPREDSDRFSKQMGAIHDRVVNDSALLNQMTFHHHFLCVGGAAA